MEDERKWFVGVDWASETHHVCLLETHGGKRGERGFRHAFAAPPCFVERGEPAHSCVAIEIDNHSQYV